MKTSQFLGYAVIYDKKDGSVGFLDTDPISGTPYFSDIMKNGRLYSNPKKAIEDVKRIKRDMRTYYGHRSLFYSPYYNEKVIFDSIRAVKITCRFEAVDEESAEIESALSKLDENERAALQKYFKEEH